MKESFTHHCRPRFENYEPPEDAVLDKALIKKAFKRVDSLLLSEIKANQELNGDFLIAFAIDISCCDTYGNFKRCKDNYLEDIKAGKMGRVEFEGDKEKKVFYTWHQDLALVRKIIALLENTYRQEFFKRLEKTTQSKE